jgi:enoyl-CoA hydratase
MTYQTIQYDTEGYLAWITLNRPEKLNAINKKMEGELNQALDRAEQDEAVRVIVLKGAGKAFSAGYDLELESADLDLDNIGKELTANFDIIMRFWNSPKPTIAAVHKYCLGAAMEMAIACDITLAAEDCRFGAPEVTFGSGIVAMLMPWFCGPKRAKELLMTGNDRVTSQQAEAWGLVNHVVEPDRLDSEARKLALQIARNDQLAVRLTKQAINRGCEIAGMREALLHGLEVDIEIETTETDESRQFNKILAEQGTKAALAWRDRQAS